MPEPHASQPKAPSLIAYIGFAIACALCGLFTANNAGFEPTSYWPFYRGVLPFCVLLPAVCVRPLPLVPISIIGCLLSWRLAFVTMSLLGAVLNDNGSVLVRTVYWAAPGLIGALGVAASIGIGAKNIFQPKCFLMIGVAGMLTASLFAASNSIGIYAGFAAWQTAVGLVIFHFAKMPAPLPPDVHVEP